MSARYDCADAQEKEAGLVAAVTAVQSGSLVVLPTDTVYGIGADAFTASAVSALAAAKGTGRNAPPSVLVGSVRAASALAESLGAFGQDLIDEFWPGPLTLIFRASPTLMWDLGDARGTVAVRMPLHPVALDLLRRTGPMAVSGANRLGQPAATTAADAQEQFGESVSVYLDAGPCADKAQSTIVDLTGSVPRVLRSGVVTSDQLRKIVPLIDQEPYIHPDTAGPDTGEPGTGGPEAPQAAESLQPAEAATAEQDVKPAEPHPLDRGPEETSS